MHRNILLFLLFATLLCIPFADTRFLVLGVPFYLPEFIIIFAAIVFVMHKWRNDILPIRKMHPWIISGSLLMLLGACFSFLSNPFSLTGLGIIKSWFVFPMLFGWLLFQSIRNTDTLDQMMLVWFGSFCIVAIIALLFFLRGEFTYDHRLKAFYASPNYLALFLFPGVFLGWFQAIAARKNSLRILSLILVFLISLAIYLTLSYTVILATLFGFFIICFIRSPHVWKSLLLTLFPFLFILSILFVSQYHSQKLQDAIHLSERSSLSSRFIIWKSSLKMIQDHPIAGIGPGRFQEVYLRYQQYFPPYLEWAVPQPHNLYLAFWLQTGIFGLAGFLVLILSWLKRLIAILVSEDKKTAALAQALFGIIATFLIAGLFDTPYWRNDLAYTFWMLFVSGVLSSRFKR